MKLEGMFHGSKIKPEINDERNNRRPTRGSHFKDKKNKVNLVVNHLQQHPPQRGSHDTDECRLLLKEESTAERRFHCIVFQLAAGFIIHSLSKKR